MAKKKITPHVERGRAKNKKLSQNPGVKVAKGLFGGIFKTIATIIMIFIITGCIVGTVLTIYVMDYIHKEPSIDLNTLSMSYTTIVYGLDEHYNDVEIKRISSRENRIWADISEIPQCVQDAFVYFEDERFATHPGIDYKRTIAAFLNEVKNIVTGSKDDRFGASTITQQLVKNINGDLYNRTIPVKIDEILTALSLEKHFTKQQILENYLNYVGLGKNNTVGVKAGAKLYFDKDISELNPNEAACLAAITKSPTAYNPIDNPENNDKRRRACLTKMLEFNAISQAEYDMYYNQPIVIADAATQAPVVDDNEDVPKEEISNEDLPEEEQIIESASQFKVNRNSYFIDAVIEEVVADLKKEYNFSDEYAREQISTAGYRIYTTMELRTQSILEDYFENEENFAINGLEPVDIPQASMVIMDYDGNIRGLVGGKGEYKTALGYNRATMSKRPAGSTIKPIAIYAPAFENRLITWSTIMDDSPIKIKGENDEEKDWPNNYNKVYDGEMLIIDALKVSKNTIPVKLCEILTPQVSFDFLYNELNMKSLRATGRNNDVTLASMALGDGGSTLKELVGAYQIFGNGGYYSEPKMYTRVLDAEGNVILDATAREKSEVLPSDTAYLMNRGLWCVVNEGGSGARAKLDNFETIGKTGTSNDRKDLLFIGETPYYVAGIRYGHDDNSVISDKVGNSQIQVWQKVMTKVHEGYNPAVFELDDEGIISYEYCKESGQLAHSGCPEKGIGYYYYDDIPISCTTHDD